MLGMKKFKVSDLTRSSKEVRRKKKEEKAECAPDKKKGIGERGGGVKIWFWMILSVTVCEPQKNVVSRYLCRNGLIRTHQENVL